MKINRLLIPISLLVTISFAGCAPKTDGEIKTEIQTNLKSIPDIAGVTFDVKGGIVTIEGQCNDKFTSASCEKIAQEVQGVKTVINNLTVANAPADTIAAPVTTPPAAIAPATVPEPEIADDPLAKPVSDIIKNFPGVQADVKDGVINLTGEIKKNDLPKLIKSLSSLKPKKIEKNLRIVKYIPKKNTRVRAKGKAGKKHATVKKKKRRH